MWPSSSPLEPLAGLYEYQSLSATENLRLLTIKPGQDGDDVCCDLVNTTFGEASPVYDALSYTWGTDQKTRVVHIDGKRLPVTANLFAALRQLRLSTEPRILWVDAICINQDDIPERNAQVLHMHHIYKAASKVLIWLGEEEQTDAEAFDLLEKFDRSAGLDKGIILPWYDDVEFRELFTLTLNTNAVWRPVSVLLERPWFRRAWVIQEVAMATQPYIVCGKHACRFEALTNLAESLQRNALHIFLGPLHGPLIVMARIRNIMQSEDEFNHILELLGLTRGFLCRDPRDHIFSLVGLLSASKAGRLAIDYSLSPEEIYSQIASECMNSDENRFRCLSFAGYRAESSELILPSWVPDWSLGSKYHVIVDTYASARETKTVYSISKNILTFSGLEFDKIMRVGKSVVGYSAQTLSQQTGTWEAAVAQARFERSMLDELDDMATLAQPYPTGQDIKAVLSRLEVGNLLVTQDDASQWDDQLYWDVYDFLNHVRDHQEDIEAGRWDALGTQKRVDRLESLARQFISISAFVAYQRKLCLSKKRYLGWVPELAEAGDIICIFYGAGVPYILRPDGDDQYKLIGECYLQGIMDGEALAGGDYSGRTFKIR